MEEIWKDIPDYEGHYQVSNIGRVKSLKNNKEKILNNRKTTKNYLKVVLYKDNIGAEKLVSRLVISAFLEKNIEGYVVNHKDHNPLNNGINNLELISYNENNSYRKNKNTSKYVGVTWNKKHKKWYSQIFSNKKMVWLGAFNTEEEAFNRYKEEFEKLNMQNKYLNRLKNKI